MTMKKNQKLAVVTFHARLMTWPMRNSPSAAGVELDMDSFPHNNFYCVPRRLSIRFCSECYADGRRRRTFAIVDRTLRCR